jgi:histidyl-tRNA synthetase
VGSTVLKTVQDLRRAGIVAEGNMVPRSLKAQFKSADRSGAKFTVIIGEDEVRNGTCNVKLPDRSQVSVSLSELPSYIKEQGGNNE